MGFSFLRKRKPKKPASMMAASSSSNRAGAGKGNSGSSRARSAANNNNQKNNNNARNAGQSKKPKTTHATIRSPYATPLVTIEEHELHSYNSNKNSNSKNGSRRTRDTDNTSSTTTTMINVMTQSDGDTELVYGDVQRQLFVNHQEDISVYDDDDDDDTTLGEPIAIEALKNNNNHFNELWEREDAASIADENSVGTPVVTRVFRAMGRKLTKATTTNHKNDNHDDDDHRDEDDDATNDDDDDATLNTNSLLMRDRVYIHVQEDASRSNQMVLKKSSSSMDEYDPPIITKATGTPTKEYEPANTLPPGVYRPMIRSRPITTPVPEDAEPFDEKMMEKEDPYIIELRRNDSKDEEDKLRSKARSLILNQQQQYQPEQQPEDELKIDKKNDTDNNNEFKIMEEEPVPLLKQNLIDAFNCNADSATNFYDSICAIEAQPKKRKRPYFNDDFAKKFMEEGMDDGVPMLWHVPPASAIDNDWTGQSVTMFISAGAGMDRRVVHPHLIWMSEEGGYSRLTESDAAITIAVDILDIHSIMDRMDDMDQDGDLDDLFFFSITTKDGTVHVFECPSERDRDRTVAGIKNVLARLTFSLIAGDDVTTMEVYGGDEDVEGALPSLKTPAQEMMNISHAFLDAIAKQ